ncbi:MAG: hypothetical protein WCA07_13315 [Gloeobacterales cyanobacterium]
MLRETIRQEIDKLSESQLRKISEFITSIKTQTQQLAKTIPFWQRATPAERAQDFRAWVAQLPQTRLSLIDEAFDRGSIYEY